MKLIEGEELGLGVDLPGRVSDRGRYLDLKGLYLQALEHPASSIPHNTDDLTGSGAVSTKLANCSHYIFEFQMIILSFHGQDYPLPNGTRH